MSKKVFNEPFLMVPYTLLRIPEYGRYFDGAPIGFIHRLLMTGVRRQTSNELRYYKEGGWVTELAKLYENGDLASYFTLESIEEATGFTVRRIRDFIKKLKEMKLIEVKEFGEGYIFILGRRLKSDTLDGYSVGYDHEGFFIDSWETWAQRDRDEFRSFIVNNLAPPKAKERLSGKILPNSGKDSSENPRAPITEGCCAEQQQTEEEETPRIDRLRIVQEDGPPSALHSLYARIRTEPSWIEAVKAASLALRDGAPLHIVNAVLSERVPRKYDRFKQFPRFALRLYSLDASEKEAAKLDYVKLSMLWKDLHEDVTGVNSGESSKFYTEVRGAYKKHLTSKYSYEQCLWALKKAVANETSVRFLVKGGRNLITLVQQSSQEYHELMREAANEKSSSTQTTSRKTVEVVKDMVPVEGFDVLDSLFERGSR